MPDSWALARLGEVATRIEYGYTASADHGSSGPLYLRITDIQGRDVDWPAVPRCASPAGSQYDLGVGDLVIARTGATTGKAFLIDSVPERAVFASYLIRVRTAAEVVTPDYLYAFTNSPSYWKQITHFAKGTAQPGANASILSELEVPVAPLAEQRRIVSKIEALSARSKRARADLERVEALVEGAKAAVLESAYAPYSSTSPMSDLVTGIEAGKNVRCEERPPKDHEKGLVKVSAVTWGTFNPKASKTLDPAETPAERNRIHAGDFLFSRANTVELVGACVIVEQDPGNLYLSDKILRVLIADEDKRWLLWYLRSPKGRADLQQASSGNQQSMRNVSQAALLRLQVPNIPAGEKAAVAKAIESQIQTLENALAEARSASALLTRLDQSILAKAFRGELVPQDDNDEPASVLLERIRAERAAAGAPRRRGRKAKGDE